MSYIFSRNDVAFQGYTVTYKKSATFWDDIQAQRAVDKVWRDYVKAIEAGTATWELDADSDNIWIGIEPTKVLGDFSLQTPNSLESIL